MKCRNWNCQGEMVLSDDHGRYTCLTCGFWYNAEEDVGGSIPAIPQVDTSGMSDTDKATIPPIHRLDASPTQAEATLIELMLGDPEAMDSPGYAAALAAVQQERGPDK